LLIGKDGSLWVQTAFAENKTEKLEYRILKRGEYLNTMLSPVGINEDVSIALYADLFIKIDQTAREIEIFQIL